MLWAKEQSCFTRSIPKQLLPPLYVHNRVAVMHDANEEQSFQWNVQKHRIERAYNYNRLSNVFVLPFWIIFKYFIMFSLLNLIVITCGPPPQVLYGKVEGSDFHWGSSISYSCADGYHLSNSAILSCEGRGVWRGEIPQCLRKFIKIIHFLKIYLLFPIVMVHTYGWGDSRSYWESAGTEYCVQDKSRQDSNFSLMQMNYSWELKL